LTGGIYFSSFLPYSFINIKNTVTRVINPARCDCLRVLSTETIVPHIRRIMYFSVMLLMWNNDY